MASSCKKTVRKKLWFQLSMHNIITFNLLCNIRHTVFFISTFCYYRGSFKERVFFTKVHLTVTLIIETFHILL